jgi:hypothetical protein
VRWTDLQGSRPAVPIATSGTHYLRVGGGDPIAGVSDRHYACGISVRQF